MTTREAITKAIDYLSTQAVEVPPDAWKQIVCKGALKADTTDDLSKINARYHDAITQSLTTYLEGGTAAGPKNSFKKATVEAFGAAWDSGWGKEPIDADALAWFNSRVEQELSYIDALFVQAKELRKDTENFDPLAWASEKADSYTQTLNSVYNAAKMYAKKNQMLTWRYGDTEHCETCNSLNGKKHKASWYLSRDYIPGKPGAAMDCGGYRCQCSLLDAEGNAVTI